MICKNCEYCYKQYFLGTNNEYYLCKIGHWKINNINTEQENCPIISFNQKKIIQINSYENILLEKVVTNCWDCPCFSDDEGQWNCSLTHFNMDYIHDCDEGIYRYCPLEDYIGD